MQNVLPQTAQTGVWMVPVFVVTQVVLVPDQPQFVMLHKGMMHQWVGALLAAEV